MSKPKLLFLATEDWFVASHFVPLLRRAGEEGFEVVVAARNSNALAALPNIRVIDTPFPRGSMRPWDFALQVTHLRKLLERERPQIIHAIAMKPAALLALSGYRGAGRVFAITGRGYLAARRNPLTKQLDQMMRMALLNALRQAQALLLVENTADRDWLDGDRALEGKTLVMPGAGVDADVYVPAPEPDLPPVVVGVVARLIWSKGIDLAVAAVQRLRESGEPIVLRVAGDIDPESPESVSTSEVVRWRTTDGIEMVGRVREVSAFWADAHIACLPSRGGEGLPRSLLEAAACGRPLVSTEAPGCGDFVGNGLGLVVPCNDVEALAGAIRALARDAPLRAEMGKKARAAVIAGYTEDHAADVAALAWRRLSAGA